MNFLAEGLMRRLMCLYGKYVSGVSSRFCQRYRTRYIPLSIKLYLNRLEGNIENVCPQRE